MVDNEANVFEWAALHITKEQAYRNSRIFLVPTIIPKISEKIGKMTIVEFNNSGMSIPFLGKGKIWLGNNHFENPMESVGGRNLYIHELFHQVQYIIEPEIAWRELRQEFILNEQGIRVYAYNVNTLHQCETLKDLGFYEAQAKLVGDFAQHYHTLRYRQPRRNSYPNQQSLVIHASRLLRNNGFITEATEWVRNNL